MSNYPDDIRRYDSDPRSPFYKERECQCGDPLQYEHCKKCGDNFENREKPHEDDYL